MDLEQPWAPPHSHAQLHAPTAPLEEGLAMQWYPPPGSEVRGVPRVLPSQILVLPAGRVGARDAIPAVTAREPDEVFARLERRLVAALQALSDRGRLAFALTAGRDWRTVFAAAAVSGIDPLAYTFWWPHITSSDLNAPPALARAAGVEQWLIKRGPVNTERAVIGTAIRLSTRPTPTATSSLAANSTGSPIAPSTSGRASSRCRRPTTLSPSDPGLPSTPEETAALVLRKFPGQLPDDILAWSQWFHETAVPLGGLARPISARAALAAGSAPSRRASTSRRCPQFTCQESGVPVGHTRAALHSSPQPRTSGGARAADGARTRWQSLQRTRSFRAHAHAWAAGAERTASAALAAPTRAHRVQRWRNNRKG